MVRGFAVVGCLPCRQRAGIPPRQAGHFLLLAQKKVTKEEGLNTELPVLLQHSLTARNWIVI